MTILNLRTALADVSLGNGHTGMSGSSVQWAKPFGFSTYLGSSAVSVSTTTVAGPTTGVEFYSGNGAVQFLSPPLAAAVTISSTLTLVAYSAESDMKANATIGYLVQKVSAIDLSMSTVYAGTYGTELGTSKASCSWTGTPTSTNFAKGDRIRVVPYIDDGGGTMASSFTVTFDFGSSTYQSRVEFTETISFMTFSGSQYLYPTNVASDVVTTDVDYKAWTSRGT